MHYRHTTRRGANHGLHLVLTVITCGLWAVTGWPIAAAMGRKTHVRATVRPHAGYQPVGYWAWSPQYQQYIWVQR